MAPKDESLAHDSIGEGFPVLILHGAYSARVELRTALEPAFDGVSGCRRLYVDLPGHGESGDDGAAGCAEVLDRLDELLGDQPFAVVGHSFGGHVARGLAARHPQRATGLALICPMLPEAVTPEPHEVVVSVDEAYRLIDAELLDEYRGYFVVHTPETARRFNEAVAPAIGRFDGEAVERIMAGWQVPTEPYGGETLVLAGRHDSAVGFREQVDLVDRYPRATVVVASSAGHALPHERPQLVSAALRDWLARAAA
jgi:pimeloyl-ACP methyl ester carboxylesterase